MSEVATIAASLAASPRFATAMGGETALDAMAVALMIKRQARAMGSPVGDMPLREIAVQMRPVLADGARVDCAHEVLA